MEETTEKRVWQRVRGEQPEPVGRVRELLERQGALLGAYRTLARRGGRGRLLLEQKQHQTDQLRGLLRALTGQGVAPPRVGSGPVDLAKCFAEELHLLRELGDLRREAQWGPIFDALLEGQRRHCRLVLELLGTAG